VNWLKTQYSPERHPEVWPDPTRFDPDRHTPEQASTRPRMAMYPFSAGYHACIGASFALQELRLALASIASRYRREWLPTDPVYTGVQEFLKIGETRLRLRPRRRG
jgi:cytochrome P450